MTSRTDTLLGYLAADAQNVALLADAAEAAVAENRFDVARDLLTRRAGLTPHGPREAALFGLLAMKEGRFDEAVAAYEPLFEASPDDPSLRFNLAWSLAMLKDFDRASGLLDARTVEALPQAATLQVQFLHDSGAFDEAMSAAKMNLLRHPHDPGLLAAVSVLALDMEDEALAKSCAMGAGGHPDAAITLGTLALGDDRPDEALDFFAHALVRNPQAPRGWLGKGLAELSKGAHKDGARHIQHGAELFDEHVGSWIAAGWAHIVNSDQAKARACFDRALALDHNFSESHGSLAALNIMEGRVDEARRQTQAALKLDSKSFSGALAQALLLSGGGKPELARALIERAMTTPIDASGRTIASAMARQGLMS